MATVHDNSFSGAHGAVIRWGPAATSLRSGDVIATGDSLTDFSYNIYPAGWGLARTMFPPRVIHNDGWQAQTMAQIVDRLQATISLYPSANTYLIRMGTNGPGTGTYQDQFNRAISILASNNKFGVFFAIPPRRGDTVFAGQNAWLKGVCAASPSTLAFVEDGIDLGDSNYAINEALFVDGIHMNTQGSYAASEREVSPLSGLFAHVDPRIVDPADKYPTTNQYVQYPFMSGLGGKKEGVVTGTVPDGWFTAAYTTANYSVTKVAADVGDPNQTPWLRITINTCNAGNMSIRTSLAHPAIAADVSAVVRFDMIAEVRTVNLDPTVITSASFVLDVANQFKGFGVKIPVPASGLMSKQAVVRSAFRRDRGQSAATITPEAFSANTLNIGLWINFNASTTSSGSIDIRCVSVRGSNT